MKFRLIFQVVLATITSIPHFYFLPLSVQALPPFDNTTKFENGTIVLTHPIRDKNNAYYIKRIGEHSEWLLTNSGRADLWNQIKSSAQRDAGNTSSAYYRLRLAEHSEWLLTRSQPTKKWWNDIESSARRDAKI